tara:strand:+ start:981 stop:1247 length:267 start_codon:yes stop_codon:yes gene_type:complete
MDRAMRLDFNAVDGGRVRDRLGGGQILGDVGPVGTKGLAIESVADCRPSTELGGAQYELLFSHPVEISSHSFAVIRLLGFSHDQNAQS